MKRIIGIILLVVALIGAVGVVKNFSRSDSPRRPGTSAYETGRNLGKTTAPLVVLVVGGIGLVLLLSGRSAATAPARVDKPWYRTTTGIVGLSIVGVAVGLVILVVVVGVAGNLLRRHRATSPPVYSSGAPASHNGTEPTQTGPFTVGATAEARFGGGWIPGKITRINPGGFTVMIQLEDGRFPHPIILSTNQIRAK